MGDAALAKNGRFPDARMKCVLRTAEAIYGTFIAERFDDVFLIKSLDFILIELESPLGIQVRSGDENCTFGTANAGSIVAAGRTIGFAAGVTFQLLSIEEDREGQSSRRLDQAANDLESILLAIEAYAGTAVSALGGRINAAVNSLSKKLADAEESDSSVGERPLENMDLLNSFITRLDQLMLTAGDICFFPSRVVGDKPCLRLFFFHQLAPGEKTRMRLHPLASQLNAGPGELLRAAQQENWNFDEVASRGLVAWTNSVSDQERHGAFANYLAHLTQAERRVGAAMSPSSNHTGLAIPMHVGGKAWLVVLFVFAPSEANRVELAHYILRSTVPVLFEHIASLVRDEYLNSIRDRARETFGRGKFDTSDLNGQLQGLAQIFPYNKEWYLSSELNDCPIAAFDDVHYLHERSAQPTDERQLRSLERTIGREVVRDKLQDTAREVQDLLRRQQEVQQGADEGIGHALKNIVELTSWPHALSNTRSLIRNYRRLIAKDRHSEILERLQIVSRSLGLFSLVAGLGHFARLTGAIGRRDYGKFVQWHDADELRRWRSGQAEDVRYVCDALVGTVCQIVAPLCWSLSGGGEPHPFEVHCEHAEQKFVHSDGAGELGRIQFDKRELHVPPFKKGSDAAYSFVFALTEPLVNALRALEELRKDHGLSASERVLRVRIEPRLPEEVTFAVINTSAQRVQKNLSGFRTTRRMLHRVGIAELSNPTSDELRPGAYQVTAEVHFRPYDLATKIAQRLEA